MENIDNEIVQPRRAPELASTSEVSPTLLNAPIYVLHDKASKKVSSIEVHWSNKDGLHCAFRFIRAATDPFPTTVHARYLDILLAMFAKSPDPSGKVYFRYRDVMKVAGKTSDSVVKGIQQTIQRYRRHPTEWQNSWTVGEIVNFSIISASSILDENGYLLPVQHNPRRSKKADCWHWVKFDERIVHALRNDTRRFFLTDLFKRLDRGAYCIYRYYYGYPDFFIDSKGNRRPNLIWRSVDQLREIFKWTGQKNKFVPWFKTQLDELLKLNLIDRPKWNETNTAVCIHCKNLADIENKQKVTLVSDSDPYAPEKLKRVGATRNISSLSNEAIIQEYLARKAANRVPKVNSDPIDMMLANPAMVEAGVDLIKRFCLD